MAFAEWDPTLETGDALVDSQHRSMFVLINELHAATIAGNDGDIVEEILYRLMRYVAVHFADEERLMRTAEYPETEHHIELHRGLTVRTEELAEGYMSGELTLSITLSMFLREWLIDHIRKEDGRLVAHIRARGAT